jgi:hypothetical protein
LIPIANSAKNKIPSIKITVIKASNDALMILVALFIKRTSIHD